MHTKGLSNEGLTFVKTHGLKWPGETSNINLTITCRKSGEESVYPARGFDKVDSFRCSSCGLVISKDDFDKLGLATLIGRL